MRKEIIICEVCKGIGKIDQRELVDYHHREWDEWEAACPSCGGTGRMYKFTETKKIQTHELKIKERTKDN
jgi:DnaJ-class molecular chaperone